MNNEERKIFWNTLNSLDGQDSQNDFEKTKATLIYPNQLCKFKKVNEFSIFELFTNQLYISSADKYDDPFDTYLYFNEQSIKDKISTHFINKTEPIFNMFCNDFNIPPTAENRQQAYYNIEQNKQRLLQEIIHSSKQIRSIIQQRAKSISFTEDFKNETLWLKYADSHKGFCLVYDLNEKLPTIEKNLFPIYYSSTPYDASEDAIHFLLATLYNYIKNILNTNHSNINEELSILNIKLANFKYKVSLIKKECHLHDQEWRYLPFKENEQYLKWKPNKIIIGLRTPKHHIELIKNSAKLAGIQNIYQVYIDQEDKLAIKKLDI